MIISASRRTDIPAYYSKWFYERVKAGYCVTVNPFNPLQRQRISLLPDDVDAFVFWTRNPAPLWKNINILDDAGYMYYFQATITGYPKIYEPNVISVEAAVRIFREISEKIGPGRMVWRYDPVILSKDLTLAFHTENFSKLAEALSGYTRKVKLSLLTDYAKTKRRLNKKEINYIGDKAAAYSENKDLFRFFAETAVRNGITPESCAEEVDMSPEGIAPGSCIDAELLNREFGLDLSGKKDKNQRGPCLCAVSKDIGASNTCLAGCEYCYSTVSQKAALNNFKAHNPFAETLK